MPDDPRPNPPKTPGSGTRPIGSRTHHALAWIYLSKAAEHEFLEAPLPSSHGPRAKRTSRYPDLWTALSVGFVSRLSGRMIVLLLLRIKSRFYSFTVIRTVVGFEMEILTKFSGTSFAVLYSDLSSTRIADAAYKAIEVQGRVVLRVELERRDPSVTAQPTLTRFNPFVPCTPFMHQTLARPRARCRTIYASAEEKERRLWTRLAREDVCAGQLDVYRGMPILVACTGRSLILDYLVVLSRRHDASRAPDVRVLLTATPSRA